MAVTQANRWLQLKTPLGPDKLLLAGFTGTETLGRPFEYELDLKSEDANIALPDLVGQSVTVSFDPGHGMLEKRHINGIVSRFTFEGTEGRFALYRATMVPWVWLLGQTTDSRIFEEMTVPDIVKEIFRDNGFGDFEEQLSGSYRSWVYCVQYRESALNFVSRLLENEGIYYYFKHTEEKHTLVLADSTSAHEAYGAFGQIDFVPPDVTGVLEKAHVNEWQLAHEVQPGSVVLNDFDFEKPRAAIDVTSSDPKEHAHGDKEIYDYPGGYIEPGDGRSYVRARLEEHHAAYEVASGGGEVSGFCAGSTFELARHPRDDQNRGVPDHGGDLRGHLQRVRDRRRGRGDELLRDDHRHPLRGPLPARADHSQAGGRGPPDRHRGRGRRHRPRRVRPGQGRVPLGPGQDGLVLGAGLPELGRLELGGHLHPPRGPRGDRGLPGGRPRPADHHGPGLQRRQHAPRGPPRGQAPEHHPRPRQQRDHHGRRAGEADHQALLPPPIRPR